jgi:hypothetical protein
MPSVNLCGLLHASLVCNFHGVGLRMARSLCALAGVSAASIGANSASVRTRFWAENSYNNVVFQA